MEGISGIDWGRVLEAMSLEERRAFARWRDRLYDLASDVNLEVGMFQEWARSAGVSPRMRDQTSAMTSELQDLASQVPIVGEDFLRPDPAENGHADGDR